MVRQINLTSYKFDGTEKFLVDTNVWLYIFGPLNTGDDYGYSDFFLNNIQNGCKVYINDIIISEYINRTCRIAYNNFYEGKTVRENYKHVYRATEDYRNIYSNAKNSVINDILPLCKLLPSRKGITESCLISECCVSDFNDEILVKSAQEYGLSVVTHDRDFINRSEDINVYHTHANI